MKIRKAISSDINGINELFVQIDDMHRKAHPEIFIELDETPRSDEFLLNAMTSDDKVIFIAVEDRTVVGLSKAHLAKSSDIPLYVKRKWVNIDTIVVHKDYRRRGLGELLLNEVRKWASENNIKDLELTLYDFNESAVEFYEKNGFKVVTKKMRCKVE